MKIALLDLVHTTCGTHSNTVPLGIGLIGVYVKKNISSSVEVKLFKEANKILSELRFWIPDIIGISQYTWGAELNLYAASLIKQRNPKCLIVAGGPHLDVDIKRRTIFLKENNFVDICVAYDGEIPFLEIVQRILNGEKYSDLKKRPGAGTYCLNPGTSDYLESKLPPPRLKSLDVFGPVYAEGVFDQFLDDGYYPLLQTHRGCPFSCAYCRTSDVYNSKMLFLSPEIFKKDMEYLGKRYTGRSEVMLEIANTNMSLFKEDFPIAHIIRKTQEKYNWPKYVHFDTGKDPKKLLEMMSILKFVPAPALQTLTPVVLKNINRTNISFENYLEFQREILRRTGENSISELILCLPGETKESFIQTLGKVINSGVQNLVIYTLMNLPGTPLATEEHVKKFEYLLRYRIVPRQYSKINNKIIIDTEEVIVGTKDMSFNDYLELRGMCFVISIFFNSIEFIPLKKILLEYNIDIVQWLLNIHKNLSFFPDLQNYYQDYLKETKEELFVSREELLKFFDKEENYGDLLSGKRGDNLLRKYKYLALSNTYSSCLQLGILKARKLARRSCYNKKMEQIFDDLSAFLSVRDLGPIFKNTEVDLLKKIHLNYDIPGWLQNNDSLHLLESFHGSYSYLVKFDEEQKKMLQNLNTHKNFSLSLQILYRDGHTKDLWPKWILQNDNN